MNIKELPQHHALLLVGQNRKELFEELAEELSSSFAHFVREQTVFDIDSAKELISWVNNGRQVESIALISFHTATFPTQNALLKILEEPSPHVRFILLTTNKENLLPTFLSRTQVFLTEQETLLSDDVKTFLTTKPLLRMKLPHVLALLNEEDEKGRKDREQVRLFLLLLLEALSLTKEVSPHHLKEVLEMSSYAQDPSSSGKALLEYVSLLLPKYDTIS